MVYTGLSAYTVIPHNENERWDAEVKSLPERDIYYYSRYCRLYQMLGEGDPYLFVYKEGEENKVIYPFLKRGINIGHEGERYFDITTPFGYGGPLASVVDPVLIKRFRTAFHKYCLQENIVTEFIRFHPLLQNEKQYRSFMNVIYVREMVFIDLRKHPDKIFQEIGKSNRNKIRKAQKANCVFKVLHSAEAMHYLDQFLALYYQTMDRNNATQFYYFPKSYFERLLIDLPQQVKMTAVFYENKLVAGDIIFCEGDFINSHVNAGDADYFSMGTNPLLLFKTALWGKQRGFKYIYLGGGYEKNDSLFKFKLRFNPEGIVHYYTGTKVHIKPIYEKLVNLWRQKHAKEPNTDYFPLYRQ